MVVSSPGRIDWVIILLHQGYWYGILSGDCSVVAPETGPAVLQHWEPDRLSPGEAQTPTDTSTNSNARVAINPTGFCRHRRLWCKTIKLMPVIASFVCQRVLPAALLVFAPSVPCLLLCVVTSRIVIYVVASHSQFTSFRFSIQHITGITTILSSWVCNIFPLLYYILPLSYIVEYTTYKQFNILVLNTCP